MKKFLLRLLNYIVIVFIVSTILQLIISYRIKDKTLYGSDNLWTVKNEKNDIVFLGDSRCYYLFDPRFFHDSLGINSVNLGIEGHSDVLIHTIRLKYYLAYNPPPKLVILSFDPSMNNGPFNVRRDFSRKDYFSRYAFFPRAEDKEIVDYYHYNFMEKYAPLYALLKYNVLLRCILCKKTQWEKNGYAVNNNRWDTVNFPYLMDEPLRAYNNFAKYYDSIKIYLQAMNNLCKQNNIKLICIQTPVYKGIYSPGAYSLANKMCEELGILTINTNEDHITGNAENFADQYHLNTTGVQLTLNDIIKNKTFIDALKN